MKKVLLKINFYLYILSLLIFYSEIFLTWIFNLIDGFYPRTLHILATIMAPVCFLIIFVLDPKKFFKFRFLIINFLPFFFALLFIGEIQEHGWVYLAPNFH